MNWKCITNTAFTPLQRRYGVLFYGCWGLTAVFMLLVKFVFLHQHPVGIPAYVLAVVPAVPFVTCIVIAGRYLYRETDEFMRILTTQSMLWGAGITLAVDSTWGFLSIYTGIPPMPFFFNYTIFFICYALAGSILRIKYK